jgi:hypothetical protein
LIFQKFFRSRVLFVVILSEKENGHILSSLEIFVFDVCCNRSILQIKKLYLLRLSGASSVHEFFSSSCSREKISLQLVCFAILFLTQFYAPAVNRHHHQTDGDLHRPHIARSRILPARVMASLQHTRRLRPITMAL